MTILAPLLPHEQQQFDSPPNFDVKERAVFFKLDLETLKIIGNLANPTTMLGFVLQLGYFRANAKFFSPHEFRTKDIEYVTKSLHIKPEEIGFKTYQKRILQEHRTKILKLLGWKPFDQLASKRLAKHISQYTQHQLPPRQIFMLAIDFCWQNKIEVPTYNALTQLITASYNHLEQNLLNQIDSLLNQQQKDHLLLLIHSKPKLKMSRPIITLIKKINQSLQPAEISNNVEAFDIIKSYFDQFKDIIAKLNLSNQATEYFAVWVKKATTYQLSNFADKNKLCLYLLAFIKHQYYLRQDGLVDIFLKSVQASTNKVAAKLDKHDKANKVERNKAMTKLSSSHENLRTLVETLTEISNSKKLLDSEKLAQITSLLNNHNQLHSPQIMEPIIQIEDTFKKINQDQDFFNVLESCSIKLQRRVSQIVISLDFNSDTSDVNLMKAVSYFQIMNGEIRTSAPTDFLEKKEKDALRYNKKFRTSLYKALLFNHMFQAIKAGNLNLRHSYRYKSIQEYLIDKDTWSKEKQNLLLSANLNEFSDCNSILSILKQKLESMYAQVNHNFITGVNQHLTIEDDKIKINTPKTDSSEEEYIPSLLSQLSYIPILQVLSDVDQVSNFSKRFKHHSIKHKKMKPEQQTIFAGILGNGCNIGINRMAHISSGISEDVLTNTVNWCFSLTNVQNANNKILSILNKLVLANSFRANQNKLHTSSDGRKVTVAVDSLNSNYSFKYFGKSKGATVYTFSDERCLLFHSNVISSSEREAPYVIDGLLQNEVVKSDIHSTDTHGYTETIFAATHFLGVTFAPRIKNVVHQNIYSFVSPSVHEKKGYKILPSRLINQKLIIEHWDDILRFIATIKLKYASASLLFQRLSSYAKDNPLYKAIKEFGRIIKSIFILSYYDDLELRQHIEKILNIIESSNKFSKAVFFASSQEFKQATKEEQEIAIACMVLIQNAIVLWNYLYLSHLLANNDNLEERQQMLQQIKSGSVVTWQHINLQGEYDFTKKIPDVFIFNMEKIRTLKL